MHKLLIADLALTIAFAVCALISVIVLGSNAYLYFGAVVFYGVCKVVAAQICPYEKFQQFITSMTSSSQSRIGIDGFSLFKAILMGGIFLGFIFVSHYFLVFESFLLVAMRYWALVYHGS